jgi:spore coat polysaccharide biosynthesis protein SpsF (cytidylyltransferase family)
MEYLLLKYDNLFKLVWSYMENILIISQARYASTRLPGKVMLKIFEKPLLWYVIKRLQLVKTPNKLIIATATSKSNQPIIHFAKNLNLDYFAGSEDDVLDRFYQTSKYFKGEIIVRITSDCPLIDPAIIDRGLDIFLNGNYDYVSNVHPPTYPDGFDVEIFSFKVLETAWKEAKYLSEREHVTPYIWKNSNRFMLKNYENKEDLSKFRLTVDTPEDFILISKLIEQFHNRWNDFNMEDILIFLKENPDLLKINAQYERNEGYLKSLKEDKKFLLKN